MLILEKRFEDWICDNIEEVAGPLARLVGRQIVLPSGGILDVLAVSEGNDEGGYLRAEFTIIEVKKEIIDPAAVQQVLSYMGAFRFAVSKGWRAWMDTYKDYDRSEPLVRGVLAAPEIANEAAWMVMGSDHLRYAHLNVSISASLWREMRPGGINVDRVESLGESLVEPIVRAFEDGHNDRQRCEDRRAAMRSTALADESVWLLEAGPASE